MITICNASRAPALTFRHQFAFVFTNNNNIYVLKGFSHVCGVYTQIYDQCRDVADKLELFEYIYIFIYVGGTTLLIIVVVCEYKFVLR